MAEATEQTLQADEEARRASARLRRFAGWHGSALLAGFTLFGAATLWAEASGLLIAHLVALGNAFVVATFTASIIHEWGHFLGARLAGSEVRVFSKPKRLYFIFEFDMKANTPDQFEWLSIGGISANWLYALLLLILIPVASWAHALLIAVAFTRAVNVSLFEVPVLLRTRESRDPQKELDHQLNTVGIRQGAGYLAGAFVWLALV